MINIATSGVTNIYVGDSAATAVYIGDTQVWGGGGKDYSKDYFTLKALEGGTFTWDVDNVEYSLNDGAWTAWDKTNGLSVSANDKVRFRSSTNTSYNAKTITATGSFDVEGNSMSLFYGDNFSGQTVLPANQSLYALLKNNTKLINAKNLILPATTIKASSYGHMFNGCSNLISAPKLPGTKFSGQYVYDHMFQGCTSLTKAMSVLPATDLYTFCYWGMFQDCTALTTAPAILATTANSGYRHCEEMFKGCTALTTAPELQISVLKINIYYAMFDGCSNLNYIKCLATDISASSCTNNWVRNVAATGTFVKDANMVNWTTGASGIPDGWTVVDA